MTESAVAQAFAALDAEPVAAAHAAADAQPTPLPTVAACANEYLACGDGREQHGLPEPEHGNPTVDAAAEPVTHAAASPACPRRCKRLFKGAGVIEAGSSRRSPGLRPVRCGGRHGVPVAADPFVFVQRLREVRRRRVGLGDVLKVEGP